MLKEIYCLEPENTQQSHLETISQSKLPKSKFSQLVAEQRLSAVEAPATSEPTGINVHTLGKTAIIQVKYLPPTSP